MFENFIGYFYNITYFIYNVLSSIKFMYYKPIFAKFRVEKQVLE